MVNKINSDGKKTSMKITDNIWIQCVVCVILLFFVMLFYYKVGERIDNKNNLESIVLGDYSLVFQIDEMRNEKNGITLDGWAFKLETDAIEGNMEIWLYDMQTDKIIYPQKTTFIKRNDVNDYFLCEYDYSNCGVTATFNSKKIDIDKKEYEILVADKKNEKVYRTGTYVYGEKMKFCSPVVESELQVEGTDLEKIVEKGNLRMYRPEIGIYIYQYEGNLYWIADETFDFEQDNANLEYTLFTVQSEKKVAEGSKSVIDMQFYFEDAEIKDWNTGKYRVCKREIPNELSIYKVMVGVWTSADGWYWKDDFRIFWELGDVNE